MSETTLTFGELIKSGTISVTDGYRAKNSELGGNGLIFLRAGHVTDDHIDFADVERFHPELTPMLREKISRVGDVIVTTKGNSTGRTSFVDATMPTFVYSPHLSRWRVGDKSRVDAAFLRYWSRSPQFVNQMRGLASSTDMAPYLSLRDQQRLEITLPSIGTQRAIGQVLGSLDDKLEQNRRTSRALEGLAWATFKAWFVDFEPVKAKTAGAAGFPGMPTAAFAALSASLIDSRVGPVPQGWDIQTVGDATTLSRQQINPQDHAEELFEHFSIPAYDAGQNPVVEPGSGIMSQKFVVVPGCVLLSKLNPRIPRAWMPAPANGRRQIASTEFLVAIPKPAWTREFLYCLFQQVEFRDSLTQSASGTSNSHQRVRPSDLLARTLVVPPKAMIDAFSDQVVPQMALREALQAESSKLTALRDYLLPRLLSGRVRVRLSQGDSEV